MMNLRSAPNDIPVVGGSPTMQKMVRSAIARYPSWYVRAARVTKVIFSNSPEVRDQLAQFEHGSRNLSVWPGIGDLLQKAVGHEFGHAVDDNFGHNHFFTETPEWIRIHREASHFDIEKYRDEPLEYFADMVTKIFLLGPDKLATTNPKEVQFITTFVWPTLQREFGP